MHFVSIRIITSDVPRLVEFYERATGTRATWATEDFAEVRTAGATLAIASTRTEPTTMPWGNRSLLFRDPDGNLVNFFTPVTPAAIAKFAR
jgi:catechol 2,3-dioxygenase-like lactoylglutathione lyase family enzyme